MGRIRLHNGKLFHIRQHLRRLYEGAKALDMEIGLEQDELQQRIEDTCAANSMQSGVHIRLMVTRGIKRRPIRTHVLPSHRRPLSSFRSTKPLWQARWRRGFVCSRCVRRGYPDVQDQKLNSHSKLNCITACIQAAKAGADEALMLDPQDLWRPVIPPISLSFVTVRCGPPPETTVWAALLAERSSICAGKTAFQSSRNHFP